MTVIQQIKAAVGNVMETYFSSDLDVMSQEAKRIMSNPEDKKKYIEAVEKLKTSSEKEVTIILSNQEKITLI
jgi:archaellum biogenesis ATPase FlaH